MHKQGKTVSRTGPLVPKGRQSEAVYFSPDRDLVVLGTAGTGKSMMAILRAKFLSDPIGANGGPVLLVTYNNALARYLRHLTSGLSGRITVETYGKFARGYLNSLGHMPHTGAFAEGNTQRSLVYNAVSTVRQRHVEGTSFFGRDIGFFIDEVSWIASMGISTETDYLAAERIGRGAGLDAPHRRLVWMIRNEYLEERRKGGFQYDWDDVATAVIEGIATDQRPKKYKHIVIDEGQDLSPQAIRSLKAIIQPGGTVSFFGDYHQQIYGQGMSFRSCGLNISTVNRFVDNYRNTAEIARVAIAMNSMEHMPADHEDLVEPVEPKAKGIKPTLVACPDMATEVSIVQRLAVDQAAAGTVAVLARTRTLAQRAIQGLTAHHIGNNYASWSASPGIYYGTYHAAKGLEFDVVLLPFCSEERLPHGEVISAYGEENAKIRDGKLLYVAATRARAELTVTYSGAPTTLLPISPELWQVIQS